MRNSSIMVVSDLQAPFHHAQSVDFLIAVKNKYKPTRVICIGDEVDNHGASGYDKHPDLPSHGDEINQTIDGFRKLYSAFREVEVIDSNHTDRIRKKLIQAGLSTRIAKSSQEIIKAPSGWSWQRSLKLYLPNKQPCLFVHGVTTDYTWAKAVGANIVQGHFHERFSIEYWRVNDFNKSTENMRWRAFVGCLINNSSMAFEYNLNNKYMPILGCLMIVNSFPILVPMELDRNGLWTGSVP
jgi:hypothetical protein